MSNIISSAGFVFKTAIDSIPTYFLTAAYIVLFGSVVVVLVDFFVSPSYSYKGKHVLVTGGSSGIGLEVINTTILLYVFMLVDVESILSSTAY